MKKTIKSLITMVTVLNMLILTACGSQPETTTSTEPNHQSEAMTVTQTEITENEVQTSDAEPIDTEEPEIKETIPAETVTEEASEIVSSDLKETSDVIKKISGLRQIDNKPCALRKLSLAQSRAA